MSTSFLHKTVLIDSIIDKLFDTLSILMLITFQSALQHLWAVQQPALVPHRTCRKLYISVQFIVFRDRAHWAHQHQPGGHGEFPTITHWWIASNIFSRFLWYNKRLLSISEFLEANIEFCSSQFWHLTSFCWIEGWWCSRNASQGSWQSCNRWAVEWQCDTSRIPWHPLHFILQFTQGDTCPASRAAWHSRDGWASAWQWVECQQGECHTCNAADVGWWLIAAWHVTMKLMTVSWQSHDTLPN